MKDIPAYRESIERNEVPTMPEPGWYSTDDDYQAALVDWREVKAYIESQQLQVEPK
jgi:hypothetical protein